MNDSKTVLITGGAGFFGSILKQHLLNNGYTCISVDLVKDTVAHPNLTCIQGDMNSRSTMEPLFKKHAFSCVFHVAAILAHDKENRKILWSSNVDATRLLRDLCEQYNVPKIVFTSSNCLWARNFSYPVSESEPPKPIEIYGRSKAEGENILMAKEGNVRSVIFRCPTIIDSGRLGLLTILFDFIREGRKVWAIGGGINLYQFIYAGDLVDACMKAENYPQSEIFNIGSDNVVSLREVYQHVIDHAKTSARVVGLPRWPILPAMKICYWLGLSPLGPYHYKMIAESFVFDTAKIKQKLGWQPTLTNGQMLLKAYEFYASQRENLLKLPAHEQSAHKKPAAMGIIRLLKWLS
jgi:nucleoside-diphosphate-sugar epimerase